ncbi:GNAT family N-acetyltransferase [Cryobacterium sp. 1639]|uniref:GNAT family N-acetyltransferase n=1 Tax=Cryobacterium inferilacus TaxID=2866629 RepID=UPI001C73B2E0|nr:GNAT family N-acetyltransferase [Cryobacterium sp. 1639]MBX0301973.1 GNAT family N-acetyltransferase [Cryobacterium sp. 1639]
MIWTFDFPLRTERLLLRPHTLDDLDDLVLFHGDPDITRYIPWPVRDRAATLAALSAKLRQTDARTAGDWIVLAIEEAGTVVGEILLKRTSDTTAELGYVLAASAQGRGLATEAAAHLLQAAERRFGVTAVEAVIEAPNAASARVLTRLGFAPTASAHPPLLSFRRLSPAPKEPVPMPAPAADRPLLLDGLSFRMISSTASDVSAEAPTRFLYRQDGTLVWGDYTGDTVTQGRMVGRIVDDRIEISFAHALVTDGSVVMGSAVSVAEVRDDGLVYLVEEFEKNGQTHRSVCVQVV